MARRDGFLGAAAGLALAACGGPTVSRVTDEFSGGPFYYYDQGDRADVVASLGEAVEAKYALLPVKQQRLGLDARRLFSDAVAAERAVADPDDSVQEARGNLRFLDRARRLIASFHDSHFWAKPLNRPPEILNGLSLTEADGAVVVASVRPALLALANAGVAPGDAVLAIDGVPADEAAAALAPYVHASSPAFARLCAVEALTQRSFAYPERGYSDLSIRRRADGRVLTLRLPYYYDNARFRKDAYAYFAALGIKDAKELVGEGRFREKTGYDPDGAPAGLAEVATYTAADDPTWTTLRTGVLTRAGRSYGVLQLYTYDVEQIVPAGGTAAVPYLEPVIRFVQAAKARGLPLILDLRYNGGGDGNTPGRILAALAEAGATYADRTSSFRVTRVTRQMVENWDDARTDDEDGAADRERAVAALADAVAGRRAMTYEFTHSDGITADPAVGGYSLPVVALTAPGCASACDIQALLFKASRRVTLVGGPTNGTGAGFRTSTPYATTEFSDLAAVFKMSVPNFLFGEPVATGDHVYRGEPAGMQFNSENRPVEPDVAYRTTLRDVVGQDAGWYDRALAVIP